MKMRTRIQEMKYGNALGYAWGVKDYSRATKDIILDSGAFATYYSMLEEVDKHRPIQDAYKYFRELPLAQQRAYGTEWQRRSWSMYEEMHPHA